MGMLKLAGQVVIFTFFSVYASSATAQGNWEWQNPLPQGNPLNSVWCFNEHKTIAVGNNETIIITKNTGRTWDFLLPDTIINLHLLDIYFVDDYIGWMVGSYGRILKTKNGGETWQSQFTGVQNQISSVHFINSKRGWAVGKDGIILFTKDGGEHWTLQKNPTTAELVSIYFIDSLTGWVAGYIFDQKNVILKTTDGGINWKIIYKDNGKYNNNNIYHSYFTLSSFAQHIPLHFGLFDFTNLLRRRIIGISCRLMNEWNVSDNVLRQYYYNINHPKHSYYEEEVGGNFTEVVFVEFNKKYNQYEVVELFNDGFHFDVDPNDRIYGNYIVGKLEDYKNDEQIVNIIFDTIAVVIQALVPSVEIIPLPPVILSPSHQAVVSSVNPTIRYKISEEADCCGIVIMDQKPQLGKYGSILWKKEYEDIDEVIIEDKIPVFLQHDCEYHLIIWGYTTVKFVENHWIGETYSMEWSSFRIDTTAENINTVKLEQNFPNPFNNTTIITWEQDTSAKVIIVIYDILGKEVINLLKTVMPAGKHFITWNSKNRKGVRVTAGTYILKAQIGNYCRSIKLVVIN